MSSFLELYESVDVIGNGSFGIIRKVRRKTDGLVFARKELNFERMSERDRKQIVAEVNILKDLHHDHIVRYHDRYVDRDAGILYIVMEYCGGGDLSTIIKQATKHNRPIPEDTIWNYFLQILLALQHCHHPHGHDRSGSNGLEGDGKERRAQILHRDLKPDNVFLDENNTVKLGDFGLSKALAQASFANTYVGTPYYMSPELMQGKAYDSKSDIWSLGCLIYELCALKPPFHEAKTHNELNILIRNGRIPPLPRGYSQSLSGVIKAMLNLNPAMRPSAAQLLQHERLELAFKTAETDKMLSAVKNHKANIIAREREVVAREAAAAEREAQIQVALSEKDAAIAHLQQLLAGIQQEQAQRCYTQQDVELAMKEAVTKREEELRVLVTKHEQEVAAAMTRREEEIMEAVRTREAELFEAMQARESQMQQEYEERVKEIEERVQWINTRQEELLEEEQRIDDTRTELERKMKEWEEASKTAKEKTPLEEVKNLLEPLARMTTQENDGKRARRAAEAPTPRPRPFPASPFPELATPIARVTMPKVNMPPQSAMKGVVLTATGETLATPKPNELVDLFCKSPKVGLNFAKIFDFDEGETDDDDDDEEDSPRLSSGSARSAEHRNSPPSPTSGKERPRTTRKQSEERPRTSSSASAARPTSSAQRSNGVASAPPTRLRRPSIRGNSRRPTIPGRSEKTETLAPSVSDPVALSASGDRATATTASAARKAKAPPVISRASTAPPPTPRYDMKDEENLPSPFLKRIDRTGTGAPGKGLSKRPSGGNMLRAVAAANSARRGSLPTAGHGLAPASASAPAVATADGR
ncbi:kinase-like protein [Schizophyllum commune H4-8]|uniref:kinase-like protein n=1 Tax=Schizophyllum commune (strain H4-8 / FGSC 9210) TaxID=578458 RepID=UPI0021608406|nr:kinase-like protein [Schizophyllum commune H4-8]KAI5887708.1 kinase-like protein [Schizophyllum commune H4-8]